MNDAPILTCYDGSLDAARAIASAATLLGPRDAVVLAVAPRDAAVIVIGSRD